MVCWRLQWASNVAQVLAYFQQKSGAAKALFQALGDYVDRKSGRRVSNRMSNASVIQRMRDLLNTYSAEAVSPYDFERAIEFHMDALEGIDLSVVHLARRLTADVVRAHFYDADEEFGDPIDATAASHELRKFIDGLPVD